MTARIVESVGLCLFFALSACAHKPTKSAEETANANGAVQISDKEITSDAAGSDGGHIAGLTSVHFDFDKSTLTSEDRRVIKEDAKWMSSHPDQAIIVEGHCDRHGSVEYNLSLGERRAESVRRYLVDLGVPADRLSIMSYGSEKLLDESDTADADAKNRRANFVPTLQLKKRAMN